MHTAVFLNHGVWKTLGSSETLKRLKWSSLPTLETEKAMNSEFDLVLASPGEGVLCVLLRLAAAVVAFTAVVQQVRGLL